jgi:DNA polymerase-3 subunit epsilon
MGNFTTVIIDFETTGLSPNMGDRTIEVGAVLVHDNLIVDRFQSLMNPGMKINSFIEDYTGISNRMLSKAPPINDVMKGLASFLHQHHLVAHNASFDSKFLDAEFSRINHKRKNEFACSMLSARRIYQDAPNHKLETLVRYKNLKTDGIHHRALADAEMTAYLWLSMISDIKSVYGLQQVSFQLMQQLGRIPKRRVEEFLKKSSIEGA